MANEVRATCGGPWRPRAAPGQGKERENAARRSHLVPVVEIDRRTRSSKIHRALDEPQAKHARVKVDVALRIACDRGDVMNAANGSQECSSVEVPKRRLDAEPTLVNRPGFSGELVT